jgi:antimicrobial peptide system SdpB family protein
MLTRLTTRLLETPQSHIWSATVGLARSLMALATMFTLLFTDTATLLLSNPTLADRSTCTDINAINLFCFAPSNAVSWAHGFAVLSLALIASGWRPRFTGMLHWWIAWSYHQTGTFVDGGDQVIMILSLLLVPVTLTDPRVWHWQSAASPKCDAERPLARLIALGWLAVIRLQVAVIYFHAAVAKFAVPEWVDGTAVYYWFNSVALGMPNWLRPIVEPLLRQGAPVLAITWGTMLLEILLAMGLLADQRHRRGLLIAGLVFHAGIAVVFSLSSFMLAMDAALLLFLGDPRWRITMPNFVPRWRRLSRLEERHAAAQ